MRVLAFVALLSLGCATTTIVERYQGDVLVERIVHHETFARVASVELAPAENGELAIVLKHEAESGWVTAAISAISGFFVGYLGS